MELIAKEKYIGVLNSLNVPEYADRDFLYDVFCYAMNSSDDLKKSNEVLSNFGLNPLQITFYLVHEHLFYLSTHPGKKQEELVEDEKYAQFLVSVALDKYFTNEHLAVKMGALTSRFSPAMSTLDLYLNFILGMLSAYKKGNPSETLLIDILLKGFQMAKCVSSLLEQGFETEAFSTWRTLHENESILAVLLKNGSEVIDRYLLHMKFALAFRGAISSKEETDAIFVDIKERMHALGLKSKDMKRFIEYGWLLAVKDVEKLPEFKLNFRDGVQKAAGLSSYSKVYEMSSEIAHSSPLLIYSKKNYFYAISLINLYESFFRLEKVFTTIFMASVPDEMKKRYATMRNLYYWELKAAYDMEVKRFNAKE